MKNHLHVEFLRLGVALDEVFQRPPDAVVHVVQLSGPVVGLWELQQAPAQQGRAERHGEVELHVVAGCGRRVYLHIYFDLLCHVLSYNLRLPQPPQWGAADAEIKVPFVENTELKGSSFQVWSRSVYSHILTSYAEPTKRVVSGRSARHHYATV